MGKRRRKSRTSGALLFPSGPSVSLDTSNLVVVFRHYSFAWKEVLVMIITRGHVVAIVQSSLPELLDSQTYPPEMVQ